MQSPEVIEGDPVAINMRCLACENEVGNRVVVAREMMYGTKLAFEYVECASCGSLKLAQQPDDLEKYYKAQYYSFRQKKEGRLRRLLKRQRARYALGCGNVLGAVLCCMLRAPEFAQWLVAVDARTEDAILDVGCGGGVLLRELHDAGYRNLTGIDPFLEKESAATGLNLLRRNLNEMYGAFDLIMAHHSFEHMPSPGAALAEMYRLLKPGGNVLIRCPVAASRVWREYGTDWVQLDAPRHLFIPSIQGFSKLAGTSQLNLWKVTCDSYGFQFWGSELYRRGISLQEGRARNHFSQDMLRGFEKRARVLNQRMEGDSACFYLRRDDKIIASRFENASSGSQERVGHHRVL